MKRWSLAALTVALALSGAVAHKARADEPGATRSAVLTSVQTWPGPDSTRIVFAASRPVFYSTTFDSSRRLVRILFRDTVPAPSLVVAKPTADAAVRSLTLSETPAGVEVAVEMAQFTRSEPLGSQAGAGQGPRVVLDIPRAGLAARQAAQDAQLRNLRALAARVVVIDPGHGGDAAGAVGPGRTMEKDVCLAIAKKLADFLNQSPGVRAILTRDGDYNVGLRDRYRYAERVRADVFLSIHANSGRRPSGRGTEVYFLSLESASDEQAKHLADVENAADMVGGAPADGEDLVSILFDLRQNEVIRQSSDLAEAVLNHITERGQLENRGVKQAPFAVLKSPIVPSILVETAFINHPAEARLLRDPAFQTDLAQEIGRGVVQYLATAPPVSRDGVQQGAADRAVRRGDGS